MKLIPVWVVDQEVGGGLPTQRTYSTSSVGEPVGRVGLPDDMTFDRYADYVSIGRVFKRNTSSVHVASLSPHRLVEAAIGGEFGLSWHPQEAGVSSPESVGMTRTRNDPRQEAEIKEDHARADEFAVRGSVMHFLLRLGYFPNNEADAEAILLAIIADAQEWNPN